MFGQWLSSGHLVRKVLSIWDPCCHVFSGLHRLPASAVCAPQRDTAQWCFFFPLIDQSGGSSRLARTRCVSAVKQRCYGGWGLASCRQNLGEFCGEREWKNEWRLQSRKSTDTVSYCFIVSAGKHAYIRRLHLK